METYYCDGSQHKELNTLGIGITKGVTEIYFSTQEFDWKKCIYEIEAITRTIQYAIQNNDSHIVVVNDDKHLVKMIQEAKCNLKTKKKGVKKKIEFRKLVNLVKKHDVLVRVPQSEYDKRQILKCHHLSRSYLQQNS